MNSIQEQQLKIYLYLSQTDGECSDAEVSYFHKICNQMHLTESEEKRVLDSVEFFVAENNSDYVKKALSKIEGVLCEGYFGLNSSKSAQIETLWNLINLGYADDKYSKAEREVVKYLQEKWKLGDDILLELVDTADTILYLTKKKEWAKALKSEKEMKEKQQEIDNDIKRLIGYVETTIKSA